MRLLVFLVAVLCSVNSGNSCFAQTAHEVKTSGLKWEWNGQLSAAQSDFNDSNLTGRLIVKVKNGDTVDFSGGTIHGVVFEKAQAEIDAGVWKVDEPNDALIALGSGFGSFYDATNALRTKDGVNGRYAKIEILDLQSGNANAIKFTCRVHSKTGNAARLAMLGAIVLDDTDTPVDGGDANLLSLIHMPSAMVVPNCSGGNFLIGMDTASRSKLIGIPLLEAESTSAITVTAMGNLQWKEKAEQVEIGKEIQWVNGAGTHGLRIKNWDAIKGSIDVVEVGVGSRDSFVANGRNSQPSAMGGAVFARLLVNSIPGSTDTIEYNCTIHGEPMNGTVKIVAAPVPPDMPNDEDILKQLESDWAASVATNDPEMISEFFTDRFLFVGASGELQNREQHLEDFASGKLKITSVTPSEIIVQIYHDNNAAVVSSTVSVGGEFDGRDITGNYQFTDTLIKSDGRWLAASRQQTLKR